MSNSNGKIRADNELIIESEFGGVILTKDTQANGDRLMIRGTTTGAFIYLDALELERIAVVGNEALETIVAPDYGW
jgi:hypothetical protein